MLYIISAPSGAGKTSLVKALITKCENLVISVSYTTRPIRPEEVDGVNYHFVSEEKFKQMIHANAFIEYAEVFGFGYLYGTSKQWILEQEQKGKDILLEIDWQGARQIRQIYKECISIFVLPPSLEVLQKRLENRAQDSTEVIQKRMQKVRSECQHVDEFDYLIVNDDFDIALQDLKSIINAQRLRLVVQKKQQSKLLNNLNSV
jgi:guanylate kinase